MLHTDPYQPAWYVSQSSLRDGMVWASRPSPHGGVP